MIKHLRSRCPPFERAKGQCSRHVSILWPPCVYYSARNNFTRCCWLQCVNVMNINYQWSLNTEQFITANISDNALKQGRRTHSVLRQRSSQLQKYKAARMSSRIAIDQNVCGWVGHPGLTVWNLQLTQKLRMRIKYARKLSLFVL